MAKFFVTVLFLAFILAPGVSYAFENGDFQYWSTTSGSTKLNDKTKINVEEEFRLGDGWGDLYYTHTDAGIKYSLNKNVDLGVNYKQIFEKRDHDEWDSEYRPHFNATAKVKTGDAQLSNRGRLELRFRESKNTRWRIRNKMAFDLPMKWTRFNIQPYVADEIFITLYDIEVNRNRLYVGFKGNVLDNLKGEIYYLTQITKGDNEWTNYNIIGTKVKFAF
jgi:hypothetical protein